MVFQIILKKEIQNEIATYLGEIPKTITIPALDINNGLLTKGSYKIPIDHILIIKEL